MSLILDLSKMRGRISRGKFWTLTLLVWLIFYGLWGLASPVESGAVVFLINLPVIWCLLSLCVNRLHDRNYSGWWMLIAAVPVIGAAWLVWQIAFMPGLSHYNRWGKNPLTETGDFLKVQ